MTGPDTAKRLASMVGWWLLPLLLALFVIGVRRDAGIDAHEVRHIEGMPCVDREGRGWQPVPMPFASWGDCQLLRADIDLTGMAFDGAGVLAVSVEQDMAVFLNGARVRDMQLPMSHSYVSSMIWQPLGSGLIERGDNELLLELRSQPRVDALVRLGALLVGPREVLESYHLHHERVQRDGARLALALLFAVGLFVIPIALARSGETANRWFVAALLGVAPYIANFATTWRLGSEQTWFTLIHSALAFSLFALVRCSLGMLGRAAPRRLWLAPGCAVLLLLLAQQPFPHDGRLLLMMACRVVLLVLLGGFVVIWWRGRRVPVQPDGRWFAAAGLLLIVFGLFDAARPLLRFMTYPNGYVLHWAVLYLTLLMFAALLTRILVALRETEAARERLAEALDLRTRELEAEFSRRRRAEQANTLAQERQRIMRDMHDGVGGQLVALIALSERGDVGAVQVGERLRRTLEDLRLMIDSLDAVCADLSVALGMFRTRMEPMIGGQGPVVHWRTAQLPDLPPAAPGVVLHVLRILQEALANALKHAQAKEVVIGADWNSRQLRIEVRDDGIGGAGRSHSTGRGLASMQGRAREIGAVLDIDSGDGGTTVVLLVDVPASAIDDQDWQVAQP